MTDQVEIAVVGAGPGGLSAALAAAQAGAQVGLIDGYSQPGGQYFRQAATELRVGRPMRHQSEGQALWERVSASGVRLFAETVVWGAFEGNLLGLHGPQGAAFVQARAIILATGAYDRPVAFPGWTLPGVMTAGAAQALLKQQRILAGRRVLLAGTGPLQIVLAGELVRAGANVVAVLEGSRFYAKALSHAGALWGQWGRLAEGLSNRLAILRAGVPYRLGWGIVAAHGTDQVESVTIARLDPAMATHPGQRRDPGLRHAVLGLRLHPLQHAVPPAGAKTRVAPRPGRRNPPAGPAHADQRARDFCRGRRGGDRRGAAGDAGGPDRGDRRRGRRWATARSMPSEGSSISPGR